MTPEECLRQYETASRNHDLDALLELIHDDAVYWFSNGTSHVGKPAIARAIRHNFETIEGEDYRILDPCWLIENDGCAVCTYRYEWAGKINGESMSGAGRGTCVMQRRGESWMVVHEHLSQGPAS
ncbi:YybH family protein [Algisphaera agarilytica]|uniref:Ketosteroid isomerase-like protein n=1 Tax=Algisphaera agarilytica TaxID=1385975 RepID=A0A7X0H476_9BACT|nr:nuclear transport factor 2 family protein [Algisphaera agarilytica]MBB6428966.1 ketosteroid isomerase-like protein [Algisphaera agarilytica]